MKKHWAIYVIFVLVGVIIVLLLNISHMRINNSTPSFKKNNNDILFVENFANIQIKFNKKFDKNSLQFPSKAAGKLGGQLSELTKNGPKLFFRFSENHCEECINAQFKLLDNFGDLIKTGDIVLLISYRSNHAAQLIRKNYHFTGQILNIDTEELAKWGIEKDGSPYFFMGDKDALYSFFVPEKDLPVLTVTYFKNIGEQFNEVYREQRENSDLPNTEMTIEKTDLELKNISLKQIDTTVKITNSGKNPLFIKKVSSSCECAVSSTPRYPILPGESSEIKILFSPGKQGMFDNRIEIFANTSEVSHVIKLRGNVR